MKPITHHAHATEPGEQQPDTQPGNYYVTATDGAHFHTMLGPFKNDHAGALAQVQNAKDFTIKHDRSGRAHFMGWGTVRMAEDFDRPGNLNNRLKP